MVIVSEAFSKWFDGTPPKQLLNKRLEAHTGTQGSHNDLVSMVEDVADNEVVISHEHLALNAKSARNFRRYGDISGYGNELRITKNVTNTEAIEQRLEPAGLIIPAFVNNKGPHNGYAWVGPTDRELRVIPLLYCVEGAEIAALKGADLKPMRYGDHYQSSAVPSRHVKKKKHNITISRIPFKDKLDQVYSEWMHLRSSTTVEAQQWQGASRNDRKSQVHLFVPHDIALYHTANDVLPEGDRPAFNPFLIPTAKTVDFVDNMRHHVVQMYRNKHNDLDMRNLGVAEKEALLWLFTEKYADRVSELWRVDHTPYTMRTAKDYLVKRKETPQEPATAEIVGA